EELFLATRHPVVVTGTHGKTTTTSLLAQVLHHAGYDPSLLVGGVPLNFNEGFRLGKGEHFVIEGDEYDTAYFDKGPKFLHYRPRTAIVTGAEFDHADIYRDTAHNESAFEKFYALLPQDGYVAACSTFANWKRLAASARCRVESYSSSESAEADWMANWISLGAAGASFEVAFRGTPEIRVTPPAAGPQHGDAQDPSAGVRTRVRWRGGGAHQPAHRDRQSSRGGTGRRQADGAGHRRRRHARALDGRS